MIRRNLIIVVLAALLGLIASIGVSQATHNHLDVCCAWDSSLTDGELTYTISGGNALSQATVDAAINDWEDVGGLLLTPAPEGTSPDIKVRLRGGGGPIAGTAKRRFDGDFIKFVDLSISGKFLGEEVGQEILAEVARHETGHALGVGHATVDDLMDRFVGGVTDISICDINGVLAAQRWALVDDPVVGPEIPDTDSVDCDAPPATPENDVTVTEVTASPNPATQGDVVDITVTVANHGSNDASGFVVTLTVSDVGSVSYNDVALASGATRDFGFTWTTSSETTPDDYTVTGSHSLDDGGLADSQEITVTIEAGGGGGCLSAQLQFSEVRLAASATCHADFTVD